MPPPGPCCNPTLKNAGVSRHTRHRRRDRAVKAELKSAKTRPCICEGQRNDACQPFSKQEMLDQLRRMKLKKAPGADGVCTEHLRQLDPRAQDALLRLINLSFLEHRRGPLYLETGHHHTHPKGREGSIEHQQLPPHLADQPRS